MKCSPYKPLGFWRPQMLAHVDLTLPEDDEETDGYLSYFKGVMEPNQLEWENNAMPFELPEEEQKALHEEMELTKEPLVVDKPGYSVPEDATPI